MTPREMVRITNGQLSAAINPWGAELSHLEDMNGRELMTDADPAFWTGRAPILFPVIGVTNGSVIRLGGREYPMAKHGFARHSLFEVVAAGDGEARFALADSDETRESYPFAFRLEIGFRLDALTLHVDAVVTNRGDRSMPAQFGFHPAFAWPLPFGEDRAAHRVTFARPEPARLKEIAPDGLIAAATRPSPLDPQGEGGGTELLLRDALFEHDALVWDPVVSQEVTYGAAQGPVLRVAFPDTPRLGIWTKPGARFVCIEPWHGIADPEGFTGDFHDKPGVFEVPAGESRHMTASITLVV